MDEKAIKIADLTDDEFEQAVLTTTVAADIDEDDAYAREKEQLSTQLSNMRQLLTAPQRRVLPYLASGDLPYAEIARKARVSAQSVGKYAKDQKVLRAVAYARRLVALHETPAQVERLQMLWRIAKRNEIPQPNTAISALKAISAQLGEGRPDTGDKDSHGLVINIQNFTVSAPQRQIEAKSTTSTTIEGEFKPVTVETDDA